MEKKLTFNEATLVWWFIGWRTALSAFAIAILVNVGAILLGNTMLVSEIKQWVIIIFGVFFQIFFIRMAINRDYKSTSGTFRLAALESDQSAPSASN